MCQAPAIGRGVFAAHRAKSEQKRPTPSDWLGLGLLSALGFLTFLKAAEGQIQPYPPREELQKAEKLQEEIFGAEIRKASTPGQRSRLAEKMLRLTREEKEAAPRWMLAKTAKELAIQTENSRLAVEAAAILAEFESAEGPISPSDAAKKAHGLWASSELLKGSRQLARRIEAAELYLRALDQLTGVEKTIAEWRLKELGWSKKKPGTPPPEEVTKAWQSAGAVLVWIGIDERIWDDKRGYLKGFLSLGDTPKDFTEAIPAFWFVKWPPGNPLKTLPSPPEPFALSFEHPEVRVHIRDEDLELLARFPNLQYVIFYRAPITDEGLRRLAQLRNLQGIFLHNIHITDKGLEFLASLPNLQSLYLGRTKITHRGLDSIARMRKLRRLQLIWIMITDQGMARLASLQNLEMISLWGAEISEPGLASLASLQNLRVLYLGQTKITDAGLRSLVRLQKLQGLALDGTRVTDAGLVPLVRLENLQWLSLRDTQITDRAIIQLARLQEFQWLSLKGTQVTDGAVPHLAKLQNLQWLELTNTKITEAGVAQLQKALPGCRIIR